MIKFGKGVVEPLEKIAGTKAEHKGGFRGGKMVKLGSQSIKVGARPPVGPEPDFDPEEVC